MTIFSKARSSEGLNISFVARLGIWNWMEVRTGKVASARLRKDEYAAAGIAIAISSHCC
jgi:hypothetical protein